MQISYEWLMEYIPFEVSVDEMSEILTTIGLEVEDVELKESIKGSLNGVVVGEVITCEPHPNADRLRKTKVNVGGAELLDIVCGAPNVAQGQKVLVAQVGTHLYPNNSTEPLVIKPSKIRGEKSEGMLCAEDELGLGQSHDGILVLDASIEVGTPASEVFNIPAPQVVFHIGLTPNRSDAMSHIGVAQDVIAYWNYHKNTQYEINQVVSNDLVFGNDPQVQVHIKDEDLCSRFATAIINGVQVAPSPEWLKKRIESIGLRSINNIVDVSNYILHEWGQPIHIYDFAKINGGQIFVQNPEQYEKLITLDKQEIKLHEEDIVIADAQQALGLAGVMGGLSSSVTDETQIIMIESASFNPKWIRRTSLRHDLRTDAAVHFEKSTSIDKVDKALLRTIELIQKVAGGSVTSPLIDIYPKVKDKKQVDFLFNYIRTICGKNYSKEEILKILTQLGFDILKSDDDGASVLVPYSKSDIALPADIAEEILRIDGLNNIAMPSTIQFTLQSKKKTSRQFNNKMCDYLSHFGFQEILTNSIINSKNYPNDNIVKMMNSLTSELDAMRPSLQRSGLEVIEYNINRGQKNILIYELGQVYKVIEEGQYHQSSVLGLWVTGLLSPKQWSGSEVKVDIYWLKGVVQNLFQHVGVKKYQMHIEDDQLLYKVGKDILASIQIVDKKTIQNIGIKQDVIYAELYPEVMFKYANSQIQFKPLNKYPQMDRDLSIILSDEKKFVDIEKVNAKIKSPLLKNIKVFDIYSGENLGSNKKSWSLNYTFISDERTLTDKEVDEAMANIMELYQKELAAEIRK